MISSKMIFFTGIMVLYELILNIFLTWQISTAKEENHKLNTNVLTDAEKLKSGKVWEMSDVTDSYIVTGQQLSLQSERNRFN